jgi:hypothetical protein
MLGCTPDFGLDLAEGFQLMVAQTGFQPADSQVDLMLQVVDSFVRLVADIPADGDLGCLPGSGRTDVQTWLRRDEMQCDAESCQESRDIFGYKVSVHGLWQALKDQNTELVVGQAVDCNEQIRIIRI